MLRDIKLMWKIDPNKQTFKLISIMLIFSIVITTPMFDEVGYLIFLFYIVPIIVFCIPFFSYYRPNFRKVEKEIELQDKYSFMYSKFIKR